MFSRTAAFITYFFPVLIAGLKLTFPSRTRSIRSLATMVLHIRVWESSSMPGFFLHFSGENSGDHYGGNGENCWFLGIKKTPKVQSSFWSFLLFRWNRSKEINNLPVSICFFQGTSTVLFIILSIIS